MTVKAKSSEIIIAAKRTIVFGTALENGPNNGIKAKPGFSLDRGVEDIEDDSMGTDHIQDSDNTQISASTTIPLYARYNGQFLFVDQAMGTSSIPSYQGTLLHSGTSNAANSDATHLEYLGGGFGTAGELDDKWLTMRTGTGAYQARQIISHTDTILTVATMTDPAGDTTFEVSAYGPADLGESDASGAATLIDATKSWDVDGFAGDWVKNLTTGEVKGITSNTSTTLTVDDDWITPPTGTDLYEIFGGIASHEFTIPADNVGKFLCLAIDNAVNVDEGPGCKLGGLTLSGTVGQAIDLEFPMMLNDRETASAINTAGTMANVTIRETSNRILYNQLVMRMNNRDEGALNAEYIYPNSFSLTGDQPKIGVYGTTSGFDTHDEPQSNDFFRGELTLGFADYTAKTHFTNWAANTKQKLDMLFTGLEIQDDVYRSLTIQMPNAKIMTAELPYDTGLFQHPVTLKLHAASVAPTGMSGVTSPFKFIYVTDNGGKYDQAGND